MEPVFQTLPKLFPDGIQGGFQLAGRLPESEKTPGVWEVCRAATSSEFRHHLNPKRYRSHWPHNLHFCPPLCQRQTAHIENVNVKKDEPRRVQTLRGYTRSPTILARPSVISGTLLNQIDFTTIRITEPPCQAPSSMDSRFFGEVICYSRDCNNSLPTGRDTTA